MSLSVRVGESEVAAIRLKRSPIEPGSLDIEGRMAIIHRVERKLTQLPQKIQVTAYSGYKANERPLTFDLEGERFEVREIIDRWYGVESDYFKVLAGDGRVYIMKWHRLLDVWLLVDVAERMGQH